MSNLRLASLSLVLGAAPAWALSADEPTLEQRLERLAERLESERRTAHVPGMAISIVKDGEVVCARGFGVSNVETGDAVTPETIFACGSTTKAFTATLVGMLADEGKARWDDPVTKYLPYFDLAVKSDDANAECTLRDLLSHRHGFTRMGILWAGGGVPREKILRTAVNAEPWDHFRENFHYCNVTYLAAGMAAGVAAEATWDELVTTRIFEPLEMKSTSLSVAVARKDPRLSLGYAWDDEKKEIEHKKMLALDNIGPAGSINSNVIDMAQWIRLQLRRGEVDGKRLISEATLRETWSPQIEIGPGVAYGLGWMLRQHDGRNVVEHGGNIDGFSAQFAFVPDENVGYALLMNLDVSPLQQASIAVVFDELLGEWEEPAAAAEAADGEVDYADYTGIYVANFATFEDEEFEVLVQDDHLAVDVPSQMTFALHDPDDEGKWTFRLTDTIAVSFERDDAGRVVAMKMYQAGFTFEIPREGVEIEPEEDLAALERFLGTYRDEANKSTVRVVMLGGRLAVDNGNGPLDLSAPDAEGKRTLRARTDISVRFEEDSEGLVEGFVFHDHEGKDAEFTRQAGKSAAGLPTLEELLALRKTDERTARQAAAKGIKTTGNVRLLQAGLEGEIVVYVSGDERYANYMDFGPFGQIQVAVTAPRAWSYNSFRGLDELEGTQLELALAGHPHALEGDWRLFFDEIDVLRRDEWNDRPVVVVRLSKGNAPSRTYFVDSETGDVLRVKAIAVEGSIRLPVTIEFGDFREEDGIRAAYRTTIENEASGRTVIEFTLVETGLDLADDLFRLEEKE